MDPQLSAFVKKVSADDALKEKVKSITSIDGLITLMKDNGFTIEAEIFEDKSYTLTISNRLLAVSKLGRKMELIC